MAKRLLVVERENARLYDRLERQFATDGTLIVIRDRRLAQRRQRPGKPDEERRRGDRRVSRGSNELRSIGFFVAGERGNLSSLPDRPRFIVVVPPDLPDVHMELAQELSPEGVRVVLDRRREESRRELDQSGEDPRRVDRRGQLGREEEQLDLLPGPATGSEEPSRLMYIVSRAHPEQYEFVRQHFADEPSVEVLFDRRQAERRAVSLPTSQERRIGDRRRNDVEQDLRAVGWALVREPA